MLGVTPPISTAASDKSEVAQTAALLGILREKWNQFETEEEATKREMVLASLDAIFKDFVTAVSIKKNLPESIASEAGGMIFTFGSYRLGVHGRGSDIDTLCVAPKHVQREEFFTEMYEILKARPESVSEAYVPVLKFEFSGISIDLVFARLSLPIVNEELDLSDDNLLKNLDERCVRSRVTDDILRLVPNIDSFHTALRCIKVWAKQRAIYSNVMGFFGGVAWAIVVARVCQLYPNVTGAVVVHKFFNIMLKWNWPQPVILRQIEDGPLAVKVWNPRIYTQDKLHKMPVITPAYPSMCSTHNVTASTYQVTLEEFSRGAAITEKIFSGKTTWDELFEKDNFFDRYKYYLQIIASSDSEESHLRWSGLVESKLRQLVMKLETVEHLKIAHPYIKGIERITNCLTEEEAINVGHGIYPPTDGSRPSTNVESLSEANKSDGDKESSENSTENKSGETLKTVYTTTFYIGLQIAPKDMTSNAPRKLDISWPTQDFSNLVKMWDSYDQETMGIVVQYIKSSSLPPELVSPESKQKKRTRPKSIVDVVDVEESAIKRIRDESSDKEAIDLTKKTENSDGKLQEFNTSEVQEIKSSPTVAKVAKPKKELSPPKETSTITPHYGGLSAAFSGNSTPTIKITLSKSST